MPPKRHLTTRRKRLGAELRRLREAADLKSREAAALLGADAVQISQIESGVAGVSAERVRRLAAHYGCTDEPYIEALVAMATDRTRGWWEEFRGVLPPVFMDAAEVEHHATFVREVMINHVPGLLQTPDYARAVFSYMRPELSPSEVTPRVEHRMARRAAFQSAPKPYETLVHEFALRVRVSDRQALREQLGVILDEIETGRASVRVIPLDQDGFAGAGTSMTYLGGPVPKLDTGWRDSPAGNRYFDSEPELMRLQTLYQRVKSASLEPDASRDFIHRLAKEL
ncbi:helix-turn-helix transcriptional regulator [Streptomyces sp. NPDC051207]|uniref:helix-turn-helix domain-containing protein n=1 Tax=Streptomyces sp. NPDC051207 TaxID=3154641 RepID=UPI00343E29F8